MKKVTCLILTAILSATYLYSQDGLQLTFTAIDSASHLQPDSIKIMNQSRNCDTVLFWPDTVLTLIYVGTDEVFGDHPGFLVHQNFPNPVIEQTTVRLCIPEKDKVMVNIIDVLGRNVLSEERLLEMGTHDFVFRAGSEEIYFFKASWRGNTRSIKIINTPQGNIPRCRLDYIGNSLYSEYRKNLQTVIDFDFKTGDQMLYIAYGDTLESGILDKPFASDTIIFQFATNIPCPGASTITYGSQTYNTIQILSQCWMKENLNVGLRIDAPDQMQTNNDIIEKYCYDNEPDSCTKYGGIYQWDEIMDYTTEEGTRGICPDGWHVPSDEEWKVLEGTADSQFGIGDSEWDAYNKRGFDAGKNLKTISGWEDGGNGTDLFNFSGLPGGGLWDIWFGSIGAFGSWWTSTESGNNLSWYHGFGLNHDDVSRNNLDKENGYSVRCIKDRNPIMLD